MTGKPTYLALTRILESVLGLLREVAANTSVPGRLRFRCIRCAQRIEAAINAARKED